MLKLLSTTGSGAETIGSANPFRYRGYYYDNESGLYYLNSRYYDPQTGRFVNADTYITTGQGLNGTNMFAYCGNSPVYRLDLNGENFLFGLDILFSSDAVSIPRWNVDLNPFSGISIPVAPSIPTVPIYGPIPMQYYDISRVSIKTTPTENSATKNTNTTRSPDPIAKRYKYSSRKKAEQAARKAGKGKKPRFDRGPRRPHFHPNVPEPKKWTPNIASPHDHYYFSTLDIINNKQQKFNDRLAITWE